MTITASRHQWTIAATVRRPLLAGELDDVAFTVDDDIPTALYTPAGETGEYDAADITEDFVEIYQGMTAGEIVHQLSANKHETRSRARSFRRPLLLVR